MNKFNLSPCRGRNQTHNKPADSVSTAPPPAPPCGANAAAADDDSPTAPSVQQQDELHVRRLPSHSPLSSVAAAHLRLSGPHRFEHLRGKRWQEGDARRVLERSREVAEAACQRTLLLLIHSFGGHSHALTRQLSMAKFLAEILGCTLPDKGAPPLIEVRDFKKNKQTSKQLWIVLISSCGLF